MFGLGLIIGFGAPSSKRGKIKQRKSVTYSYQNWCISHLELGNISRGMADKFLATFWRAVLTPYQYM